MHTAAGESWTFHDPSLTTWEARELHRWLQRTARGRVEPTDNPGQDAADVLAFTEPNLAFSVASVIDGETVLRVHLSLEAVAGKPLDEGDRARLYEYSVLLSSTSVSYGQPQHSGTVTSRPSHLVDKGRDRSRWTRSARR